MNQQRTWTELLQPAAAMLKFRLPWPKAEGDVDSVEYFDGEIILQPYISHFSAESRLVVIRDKNGSYPIRKWSCREYEERMMWWNFHERIAFHDHSIRFKGIDHCWDCWAFQHCVHGRSEEHTSELQSHH